MSSRACDVDRSEGDGATNGATDCPFFRLLNEFAGDFVDGSLPDGCISNIISKALRAIRALFLLGFSLEAMNVSWFTGNWNLLPRS